MLKNQNTQLKLIQTKFDIKNNSKTTLTKPKLQKIPLQYGYYEMN